MTPEDLGTQPDGVHVPVPQRPRGNRRVPGGGRDDSRRPFSRPRPRVPQGTLHGPATTHGLPHDLARPVHQTVWCCTLLRPPRGRSADTDPLASPRASQPWLTGGHRDLAGVAAPLQVRDTDTPRTGQFQDVNDP